MVDGDDQRRRPLAPARDEHHEGGGVRAARDGEHQPARARRGARTAARGSSVCGVSSRCAPTSASTRLISAWEAPGYLRPTSASVAQAAPFSPSAASDIAELGQRVRALGAALARLVDGEEGVRRIAILALLEMALTQPELSVGGLRVAGKRREPVAKALFRQAVVAGEDVAVGEVVFVARRAGQRRSRRRRAGKHGGLHRVRHAGIDRHTKIAGAEPGAAACQHREVDRPAASAPHRGR